MGDFPKFVEFHEEGPREGFQIEKTIYPIERRVELIDLLSETDLKRIQVGSFVSPPCGCNLEGEMAVERVLDNFRWIVRVSDETQAPLPKLMIADTMG